MVYIPTEEKTPYWQLIMDQLGVKGWVCRCKRVQVGEKAHYLIQADHPDGLRCRVQARNKLEGLMSLRDLTVRAENEVLD